MKSEKKIFGFHKNIFFLGLVSFFADVSSEMIYPLLPIFLTSVLEVGTTFFGLVEGIAEATASLLKVFSGWLLYGGVYFGFSWANQAPTVWLLFAVYGLFYGLTGGGERALVAELVPGHLRGTAYGLYNFCVGMSTLPASLYQFSGLKRTANFH